MRILAFDTATPATTVALCGEHVVELRDDPPPGERPRHATRLLGLITEVLEGSSTGWDSVERIAVGVGPGTFTGLRIGIATAKALARAADVALVGVSTLQSLALNARRMPVAYHEPEAVAAILDARRGEAFAAVWPMRGLEGAPALAPRALTPDALAQALTPYTPGLVAVGDGALAFREHLEQAGVLVPDGASELHRVTAAAHCRLAQDAPVTSPDDLEPDYQRPPDAKPR